MKRQELASYWGIDVAHHKTGASKPAHVSFSLSMSDAMSVSFSLSDAMSHSMSTMEKYYLDGTDSLNSVMARVYSEGV